MGGDSPSDALLGKVHEVPFFTLFTLLDPLKEASIAKKIDFFPSKIASNSDIKGKSYKKG